MDCDVNKAIFRKKLWKITLIWYWHQSAPWVFAATKQARLVVSEMYLSKYYFNTSQTCFKPDNFPLVSESFLGKIHVGLSLVRQRFSLDSSLGLPVHGADWFRASENSFQPPYFLIGLWRICQDQPPSIKHDLWRAMIFGLHTWSTNDFDTLDWLILFSWLLINMYFTCGAANY